MNKFVKEQSFFMLIMIVAFWIAAGVGKMTSSAGNFGIAALCTLVCIVAFILNLATNPFSAAIDYDQITSEAKVQKSFVSMVVSSRFILTIVGFTVAIKIVF
ncbi:MAG: hypothetical protein WC697_00120 [Patescibacteria group bacterium]|jgi:hypothetical protein